MSENKPKVGSPVRESITAWCAACGGTSFMPPGVEDPNDPGTEIRKCEEGHDVRTTRYVFTSPKDATRFDIPLD